MRQSVPSRYRHWLTHKLGGCFGCFGAAAKPQTATPIPLLRRDGMSDGDIDRVFATFNVTQFAEQGVR